MTPIIQWASKFASAGGKYDLTAYQWFDATNAMRNYFDSKEQIDVMSEIVSPMPFHKMFICLTIKDSRVNPPTENKIVVRVEEEEKDGELFCTVATLGQSPNGLSRQLGVFSIIKKNGIAQIVNLGERFTREDDIKYASMILAVFQKSLISNSIQVYQPYVKNSYTNQRLIKKGKTPSFEWRTVTIEPSVTQSISLGGTHASPRLHDRRGHWRTMKKSGKRVWVRECKVGDPSKGVIKHDYKFKHEGVRI